VTATIIATTAARDLRALGTGGQLTIGAAGALLALLTRELSADHAALFAEPQPHPQRSEVDWYAEGSGPALPLSQLPADQQAAAQAVLDRLGGDIRALIARLQTTPSESDRFLAAMLELALRLPDADAVRVRGGRPVLVGWGHERIGKISAAPVIGMTRRPRPPMMVLPPPAPPAPAPAPAQPKHWPWLAALAISLLLLIAAALLPVVAPWAAASRSCPVPGGDPAALAAWRDADARNAELRAEFAALLDDAGRRRLRCPPAASAAAPTDATRALARGAQGGRLQIILAWDDRNDLDLHVRCPNGEELFFNARSACGGVLDVDANAHAADATATPVENAAWADPPAGTYLISVVPYEMREAASSAFRITIRQQGQPDRVAQGSAVKGSGPVQVATVQVARP
jgi:hypothetical protein